MQWLPHRNISGGQTMATIKEIAQRAGVSTTTVSNVIHGKTKKVSPANIEKIDQMEWLL